MVSAGYRTVPSVFRGGGVVGVGGRHGGSEGECDKGEKPDRALNGPSGELCVRAALETAHVQ